MVIKRIVVGRSPLSDYVVNDRYVSKQHLELLINKDGSVNVRDLGSKTGTFINGQKLNSEHRLYEGDVIKIGQTYLPWKEIVGPPQKPSLTGKLSSTMKSKFKWIYIAIGLMVLALSVVLFGYLNNRDFKSYKYYGYVIQVHKDLHRSHRKSNKYFQVFYNTPKELYVSVKKQKYSNSPFKDLDDILDSYKEKADDDDIELKISETKINNRSAYILESVDDEESTYRMTGLVDGKRYYYIIDTYRPDPDEYRSAMKKTIKSFHEKK